jgi:hypothetical protein
MLLKLFINKTERLTLRNCAFCLFTGRTVQLCFQAILWYYPLWGRLCRAVWGRLCRRHNVPLVDTTCPIKAKTHHLFHSCIKQTFFLNFWLKCWAMWVYVMAPIFPLFVHWFFHPSENHNIELFLEHLIYSDQTYLGWYLENHVQLRWPCFKVKPHRVKVKVIVAIFVSFWTHKNS